MARKIEHKDNWIICRSRKDALDAAMMTWGGRYGLLWPRKGQFWINDGIDPDTGERWASPPAGAEWIERP